MLNFQNIEKLISLHMHFKVRLFILRRIKIYISISILSYSSQNVVLYPTKQKEK